MGIRHLVHFAAALIALFATHARASDVRVKGGFVYSGVTILDRDTVSLKIRTPYGEVTLPMSSVAEIDGVRIRPNPVAPSSKPPPVFASVTPTPQSTTTQSTTPPARAASPTPARTAPDSAPRNLNLFPGSATPSPAASRSEVPAPTASPATPWHLDWYTLAAALFCLVWAATAIEVWRDVSAHPAVSRTWRLAPFIVPVAGALIYHVTRAWQNTRLRTNAPAGPPTEFVFLNENHSPVTIVASDESSGIENAKDVLKDALLDRASDIHIEPSGSEYRVRFRIDGLLHARMKFPPEAGIRLVSALKSLSQMDIAERRKSQDGRFGGRSGTREVDFRAATTPSVFGEKMVLRILDHKSGMRGLSDLGMTEKMMGEFAQVIHSRSGMILATGPTGSGKTSTLYAALSQIDAVRLNVVTIEDPVEYQLAGATQIPVNIRAGITFESGLKSILRQDPDVILVGEMRDLEAAQIALRSALTGHLVFSSLHTRDAIGTIMRLEEMGIERHLVASSLFVLIAQRLVRVLCGACRQAYESTGNELIEINIALPAGESIYRAVGCRKCDGSGYTGRSGVFEMVIFDDDLRQAVNGGVGENALIEVARKRGFRGYREDAAEKVLLGVTSVEEVLQAI